MSLVKAAQKSGPSNAEIKKKIRNFLTRHKVFEKSSFWNGGRHMSVIIIQLYINVKQYELKKTFRMEFWGRRRGGCFGLLNCTCNRVLNCFFVQLSLYTSKVLFTFNCLFIWSVLYTVSIIKKLPFIYFLNHSLDGLFTQANEPGLCT